MAGRRSIAWHEGETMGEYLDVMAVHLRTVAERAGCEATAGATLLQARAHLSERAWRSWVTRDISIPLARARELMDCAERAGASVDSLQPPELHPKKN
jgi:hypothetical protein